MHLIESYNVARRRQIRLYKPVHVRVSKMELSHCVTNNDNFLLRTNGCGEPQKDAAAPQFKETSESSNHIPSHRLRLY